MKFRWISKLKNQYSLYINNILNKQNVNMKYCSIEWSEYTNFLKVKTKYLKKKKKQVWITRFTHTEKKKIKNLVDYSVETKL